MSLDIRSDMKLLVTLCTSSAVEQKRPTEKDSAAGVRMEVRRRRRRRRRRREGGG